MFGLGYVWVRLCLGYVWVRLGYCLIMVFSLLLKNVHENTPKMSIKVHEKPSKLKKNIPAL